MPGTANGSYALSLFDVSGQQVLVSEGIATAGQIAINLNKRLASGVYFIRVNYAEQVVGSELIIK